MGRFVDITGNTYGRLTVLEKTDKRDSGGSVCWRCECMCGVFCVVDGSSLKTGNTTSCGCYRLESLIESCRRRVVDLTGRVFTRMTVLSMCDERRVGNKKRVQYVCQCECGTVKKCVGEDLVAGHTKSCGCLSREVTGDNFRTHGMRRTTEYKIWSNMKGRCQNPNDDAYDRYGGRGITCCERWEKFENFFEDMGNRPKGTSLDRIENSKGYSKDNCRWATSTEQGRNKRNNVLIEINGVTRCQSEWCEIAGVSAEKIRNLRRRGADLHKALFGDQR